MMLFLALLTAAADIPVTVGTLDWNATPVMRGKGGMLSGDSARQQFQSIVRSKACDLKGVTDADFKRTVVRFAALLRPDGTVERLLIEDVGCLPLERLVGAMALGLTAKVDAPGGSGSAWYQSKVRFDD